jgi:hypothetical protein
MNTLILWNKEQKILFCRILQKLPHSWKKVIIIILLCNTLSQQECNKAFNTATSGIFKGCIMTHTKRLCLLESKNIKVSFRSISQSHISVRFTGLLYPALGTALSLKPKLFCGLVQNRYFITHQEAADTCWFVIGNFHHVVTSSHSPKKYYAAILSFSTTVISLAFPLNLKNQVHW